MVALTGPIRTRAIAREVGVGAAVLGGLSLAALVVCTVISAGGEGGRRAQELFGGFDPWVFCCICLHVCVIRACAKLHCTIVCF